MKRLDYETLAMEEIVVEMENGFLGASVDVNETGNAKINEQQVNTSFDGNFGDDSWD